jgi:hypothetical protein
MPETGQQFRRINGRLHLPEFCDALSVSFTSECQPRMLG